MLTAGWFAAAHYLILLRSAAACADAVDPMHRALGMVADFCCRLLAVCAARVHRHSPELHSSAMYSALKCSISWATCLVLMLANTSG